MNQHENVVLIPTPSSHPAYDAKVRTRLDAIWIANSTNAALLKTAVFNLIIQIRNLFLANPTFSAQQIAPLF